MHSTAEPNSLDSNTFNTSNLDNQRQILHSQYSSIASCRVGTDGTRVSACTLCTASSQKLSILKTEVRFFATLESARGS